MKSITQVSDSHWAKISSYVNHAVVFIDNQSAEILHWHGGLMRLVNAGAADVKEFSSFESAKESQKKAVFILSSLLEGVTREILHDIIQASQFQYVVVITTAGSAIHNYCRTGNSEDDPIFFEQVEERLLEWMGNMNYTAEVFHIPFGTISLGNSLFLMPSCSRLSPLIHSDLHQLELQYNNRTGKTDQRDFESLKDVDTNCLPKELQLLYKSFVSSVDSLLSDLGVREDIYHIGYTSRLLATELDTLPHARNRRKASQNRASVVFIDRTLDMASAASYNSETLLDKIQQALPRLQGHTTDVKVNMAPLCKVHGTRGREVIASGCLATSLPGSQQSHLNSLISSKQKEALMDVNRQLVEAASTCNLPLSLKGKPTKVTADQLQSTLDLFKGDYSNISAHLDAIQVAMATSQALSSPMVHHYDELISVEKGLLQNLSDPDAPGVLTQLLHILWKKDSKEYKYVYSLDDVLVLLVYIYSVSGPAILEQEDEETQLQTALLERIMEEKGSLPPLIKSIIGEGVTERSIMSDILDDMWEKLVAVATAREHLQQFRSVMDPGSAVTPATQNSLVKQMVAAIFDSDKADLVDIKMMSSGMKDMLKSGFGLFRTVAKPRPSDHPLMILFIVGGVTSTEVKQIRDAVNSYKPDTQVLVGSTCLLTPSKAVHSVLSQNNVNPVTT